MARENNTDSSRKTPAMNSDNRKISGNLNSLLDQLYFSVNGSSRSNDVESLNDRFNNIMHGEIDSVSRKSGEDLTSFMAKLFNDEEKSTAFNPFSKKNDSLFSTDGVNIQGLFTEAYRNRLTKLHDLHEVSSQLIELREAILVTRDAITSSDIVDGRMSRTLSFKTSNEDEFKDYIPVIEDMENKFRLQEKIKNFIVPKTLEYGDYYVYRIPYSKLFEDFMAAKSEEEFFGSYSYTEKTLLESAEENFTQTRKEKSVVDEIFNEFKENGGVEYVKENCNEEFKTSSNIEKLIKEDISNLMSNITICNDPVPLNIIEEGVSSVYEYFKESKDMMNSIFGELNEFQKAMKTPSDENGIYISSEKEKKQSNRKQFSNIRDCYIKMIDPTRMLPVKIMKKVIGYYYIQDQSISPVSGIISSNLYSNQFDLTRKDKTIVDAIATKIVQSFDKKFLRSNIKFKELIVEALQYYNLNQRKIKFQFIPAEYISEFKIDEKEDGEGTSIIEPSLFYAKLYLMLLLFKIMSIILNSNDTKVNYIRSSGIDKNIRNKIEEIARNKQNRQINIMDLFNYTNLIQKIGNGNEMYIPVGKGNERGIETEILSGQDVQLNSDLLEMLRNQFILGTGVPAAILNYLNEADFAKSLEMANTKFVGRVISYQIDFNSKITELYRFLMKESTNIPENVIENFEFSFAQPKSANSQIKQDLIQNFDAYANWVIGMFLGEQGMNNPDNEEKIRSMKLSLVEEQLPMINMKKIKELFENAQINDVKFKVTPKTPEDEDLDNMG